MCGHGDGGAAHAGRAVQEGNGGFSFPRVVLLHVPETFQEPAQEGRGHNLADSGRAHDVGDLAGNQASGENAELTPAFLERAFRADLKTAAAAVAHLREEHDFFPEAGDGTVAAHVTASAALGAVCCDFGRNPEEADFPIPEEGIQEQVQIRRLGVTVGRDARTVPDPDERGRNGRFAGSALAAGYGDDSAPNADPGDCRPRDWGPQPPGICRRGIFQAPGPRSCRPYPG